MANRTVVVMMDFGADAQRRANILTYHRVKYLVERKMTVKERETGEPIVYTTQVIEMRVGRPAEAIIKAIVSSDVVIGILSSRNLNVVYELAIRNVLRGEWILLVDGDDTERALPLYLTDVARIRIDREGGQEIRKWIDYKAAETQTVQDFVGPLPKRIQAELELQSVKHDSVLEAALRDALHAIEHERVPAPQLPSFVQDLDLGEILSDWRTAFPYSIWRIRWRGKKRNEQYTRDMVIGQPTLFGANTYFAQMVRRTGLRRFPPDPDGPEAVTLEDVRRALEPCVDKPSFEQFWRDLNSLADELMRGPEEFGQTARVATPINFLDHPEASFAGRSIQVCPVAARIIRSSTQQHVCYLLIVFVDVGHRGATLAPPVAGADV